jgi:hypothetical protein
MGDVIYIYDVVGLVPASMHTVQVRARAESRGSSKVRRPKLVRSLLFTM